jgi:two-component system response regulator RegA
LILVEPLVAGRSHRCLVQTLRASWPTASIAVVTSAPSIAGAVRAVREGAAAYLSKPATADQILGAINAGNEDDVPDPSVLTLDRAIWEYMSEIVQTVGSISEAARRLGVERRSLRRMLEKYSPK